MTPKVREERVVVTQSACMVIFTQQNKCPKLGTNQLTTSNVPYEENSLSPRPFPPNCAGEGGKGLGNRLDCARSAECKTLAVL